MKNDTTFSGAMTKISPSMLSADAARLGEGLARLEACGADWAHIDVMDGVFVPNITIGQHVVRALRPLSAMPFDVHLMIVDPLKHVPDFLDAGSDLITVHVETTENVEESLAAIRGGGAKAGVSLNPGTPLDAVLPYLDMVDLILVMTVQPGFGGQAFQPHCLDKITEARRIIDERSLDVEISVDGGINRDTARRCVEAGATVLAAGSSLFGTDDMAAEIELWRAFGRRVES